MSEFRRKTIGHDVPDWVDPGSLFFATVCCADRAGSDLTVSELSIRLLDSIRFYHEKRKWFCRLALLMPDHIHLLVAFPSDRAMATTIANWKKYASRSFGVVWQKNFFDHRIRNDENWELKAEYIRLNPVRKGLVDRPANWPHSFEGN